jgi:catechol 2,3-dioxygenase
MTETAAAPRSNPLDGETLVRPVLHHVNLKTTRLDAMVEWYGTVAGLEANFRNEGIAFLSNDAANHRLALLAVPGVQVDDDKTSHDGLHHLAFEYSSLDELLGTYLRLKDRGIEPHVSVDHGLTMSFYYLDPDGNSVELQADNYGDWERSTEFIRNDPRFAANPIGAFVDPMALVEARASGASPADVHERAYRDEFPPRTQPDLRIPSGD